MNNVDIDKMRKDVRGIISSLMFEQPDAEKVVKEPEASKFKAYTGRGGRYKSSVERAGSLAASDPKQLMANLNAGRPLTSAGMEGVYSYLRTIINGTSTMKEAYSNVDMKDGEITIQMNNLDSRNGTKFILYALEGAQNAGYLNIEKPYVIQNIAGDIKIYQSNKIKTKG